MVFLDELAAEINITTPALRYMVKHLRRVVFPNDFEVHKVPAGNPTRLKDAISYLDAKRIKKYYALRYKGGRKP